MGTWYRAIQPQHWQTSLQTEQTRINPGRYNPGAAGQPGFEILYLCENPIVALFETQAMFGSPKLGELIPHPRKAWLILNVNILLKYAADLTMLAEQEKLKTTAQELTGDWTGYHERNANSSVTEPTGLAPTQQLGNVLFDLPRLEGFQTVSARIPYQRNLVIFPQKLLPGSRVEFFHPATGVRHSIAP